jgi:uncharacterized membrane protein YccC
MVLLLSSQLGEGPIESGLYRTLEVAMGGAVAVAVSLMVFPERAHGLGLAAAGRILEQMGRVLPILVEGYGRGLDGEEVVRIQDEIGRAVASFHALAEEARRERMYRLATEPDSGPLSRTLLRLRHDLVIIGRAALMALPDAVAARLGPPLAQVGVSASNYLNVAADALADRRPPPPLAGIDGSLKAFVDALTSLRREGLTRTLSSGDVERLFALGFALEQFQEHVRDLARCIEEWAQISMRRTWRRPIAPGWS